MFYLKYNEEKEKIYHVMCDMGGKETEEDIVKCLRNFLFVSKFNVDDHRPVNKSNEHTFHQDDHLFIMSDISGKHLIFKVCGNYRDVNNAKVPHVYLVSVIGELLTQSQIRDEHERELFENAKVYIHRHNKNGYEPSIFIIDNDTSLVYLVTISASRNFYLTCEGPIGMNYRINENNEIEYCGITPQ